MFSVKGNRVSGTHQQKWFYYPERSVAINFVGGPTPKKSSLQASFFLDFPLHGILRRFFCRRVA